MSTSLDSIRAALNVTVKLEFPMLETLTTIWQRVLQRPSIAPDDNFFEVGGNFENADLLFAAIAQECGREIPSATIYHAPTIATLASVLEQRMLPKFSPFVKLKPGSQCPPIHIVHGLAGIPRFADLATHIKTAHPIYGIQAQGLDGLQSPLERVEDMAQLYLDALRHVQPDGPYFLIGYSFGGLVALEMARYLIDNHKTVGLLAMIDCFPDPQYLSSEQRARLLARRTLRYVTEIDRDHNLVKPMLRVATRVRRRLRGEPTSPIVQPSRLALARTYLEVKEKAYIALSHYRPRPYRGKIKFVKTVDDKYYPDNPVAVWSGLAEHVQCTGVPGDHLNVVTHHYASLGEVLTRYVQEASRSQAGVEALP